MSRMVLVMASLLLIVGGGLLQLSTNDTSPLPRLSASRGLALTRIVLPADAPITTAAEAEAVVAWWARQESPLIISAHRLLASAAPVVPNGWNEIFAIRGEDDSLLVLFTSNQGLVGRCWFAADGALRHCDREADDALPRIIKYPADKTLPLTSAHAQRLGTYLLRLRDADCYRIIDQALVEPGNPSWERDGKGWKRSARIRTSDHEGTGTSILLDANGALRQAGIYHWATGMQAKRRPRTPIDLAEPSEPPFPVANN